MPTGAGGSAPDARQGALGGRRARLDVATSGSGSVPARPTVGEGGYRGFREWFYLCTYMDRVEISTPPLLAVLPSVLRLLPGTARLDSNAPSRSAHLQ